MSTDQIDQAIAAAAAVAATPEPMQVAAAAGAQHAIATGQQAPVSLTLASSGRTVLLPDMLSPLELADLAGWAMVQSQYRLVEALKPKPTAVLDTPRGPVAVRRAD